MVTQTKLKRRHAIALLFVLLLTILPFWQTNAAASQAIQTSAWATDEVKQAFEYKLVPDILSQDLDYQQPITRQEFSHLALRLYASLSAETYQASGERYFTDTSDPYVMTAYELGLMNGRGGGIFSPADPMTRQELAVALTNILSASGLDTSVTASDIIVQLAPFSDIADVAGWATESLAFVLKSGIMRGMGETELWPRTDTTREQAVVISLRCRNAFVSAPPTEVPTPSPAPTPSGPSFKTTVKGDLALTSTGDRSATLEWKAIPGAVTYRIDTYLDQQNFWFSSEDKLVKSQQSSSPSAEIANLRAGMTYKIWTIGLDGAGNAIASYSGTLYIEPLETQEQKEANIFSDGDIVTKEQADALMQTITVDVWRIGSDGSKYPSTASLTVHRAIADVTKTVFAEIFNGKEQFPIKDAGAYNWREPMSSGRLSHHNYGTAIDLNYNENYCVYKDGSVIGQFYAPGENPYSIPADGEVVSIFAKYGFAWGGDEWSNPNDYMHFSYLGL